MTKPKPPSDLRVPDNTTYYGVSRLHKMIEEGRRARAAGLGDWIPDLEKPGSVTFEVPDGWRLICGVKFSR